LRQVRLDELLCGNGTEETEKMVWQGVIPVKCSHGVPIVKARCIDCEIVWERDTIRRAQKDIAAAKKRIYELRAEKKGSK
jgi:hypothetical protein